MSSRDQDDHETKMATISANGSNLPKTTTIEDVRNSVTASGT